MILLIKIISTGLFIGYISWAAGTFGSLLGSVIWVLLSRHFGYYVFTGILAILGFFICDYAERYIYFEKDTSKIIVDEIAGIMVTYLTFRFTFNFTGLFYLVVGFILFRFFDIVKPPPIRNLQKLRGGMGIMLDDIASGTISNGILQVIRFFIVNL